MNNAQVAQKFVEGATKAQGSNFWSEGDRLFSYRTQVAERFSIPGDPGVIAVNTKKYSQSTSRQLSHLYNALRAAGYERSERTQFIEVHNPGRWGGRGFVWGPEYSYETFRLWEQG